MPNPVDGGAWKKFDMKYPNFAKEPRNVRLGLCADGFNPFGNLSQTYSMWPVILTTYNLPPWLCMKESNFMLTLLIPGPKSPGKDIDVYLRPLIEDLQGTPMSVNACVVDGVRYVVQSRDERRTTQNSGICAPGPDGEMSYGQLQEILEFKYLSFKVALFRVKWFDTRNNGRVKKLTFRNGMTQIIGSDDDISDDEDPLPHDLADSDVEDLINDDDGVEKKIKLKPNFGGVKAARENTEKRTGTKFKGCGGAAKKPPSEIEYDVGNPRAKPSENRLRSIVLPTSKTAVRCIQDPEALRKINAMVRGGKLRGHIPAVVPDDNSVRGCIARSDSGEPAEWRESQPDREDCDYTGLRMVAMTRTFHQAHVAGTIPLKDKTIEGRKAVEKSTHRDLFREPADILFPQLHVLWEETAPQGATNSLTKKYMGPHFSLGMSAGERFAIELPPSNFPSDISAGDMFPQRHYAGENVGNVGLGKHAKCMRSDLSEEMIGDKLSTSSSESLKKLSAMALSVTKWNKDLGAYNHQSDTNYKTGGKRVTC
ncbi:pyruvate kinase, cytosolic isozyme [Tanacetum coccineum]|uniref:Pyruvate kinase, cytosolic isozyme n=1 Tax=Tanacetum coccineum TaxID=301880 RepID=A0ABQ5BYX8_9ASTR